MPLVSPRKRVLDAACQLFLDKGYRVSMDAVAASAHVSKQTVYAYFHSKDALFRATVESLSRPLHATLSPSRGDIEHALYDLAAVYSEHTSAPSTAALQHMLVAEASHFPDAAAQLYQSSSGAILERLATRLAQSMQRGQLRPDNPSQAAELLLSMLGGMNFQRGLLGLSRRNRKEQDRWVSHAVEMFLRVYQPARSAGGPAEITS